MTLFVTGRTLARTLERMERQYAAERSELISTICHLAGRPLPSFDEPPPTQEPERELTYALPEQYPEGTWE